MQSYKIDLSIKDFTYYLMDLNRKTQTPYNSTDVKNATTPSYKNIRIELGKYLFPHLLATDKCWTKQDKEFILSNYQQEDVYDDDNKLLGVRYKYMARFLEALEEVFEDTDDEENKQL